MDRAPASGAGCAGSIPARRKFGKVEQIDLNLGKEQIKVVYLTLQNGIISINKVIL